MQSPDFAFTALAFPLGKKVKLSISAFNGHVRCEHNITASLYEIQSALDSITTRGEAPNLELSDKLNLFQNTLYTANMRLELTRVQIKEVLGAVIRVLDRNPGKSVIPKDKVAEEECESKPKKVAKPKATTSIDNGSTFSPEEWIRTCVKTPHSAGRLILEAFSWAGSNFHSQVDTSRSEDERATRANSSHCGVREIKDDELGAYIINDDFVKAVSADTGDLLKPLRIYLATQCESATRAKLNKFFRETAKITGVNLVVQMLSDQTVILLDHEVESKSAANSPIDWINNEIDEIPKTAKAVINQAFRWASGETCDKKGSNFYREVESVANGRLNIDECKPGAFYTYNDSLITFSKAGRMSGSLRIYMAKKAYVATWSKLNEFFRETSKITGFSLAVVGRNDKTVIEFTHYD